MDALDLGLIEYRKAYALQKEAVDEVIAGGPERIFFCEHPAVFTLGRLADERYILTPREELKRRGIRVLSIDRGGEVTLHAPGQMVVYPILDLKRRGKDLHEYLRRLEGAVIEFLKSYDVAAARNPGKTGVWVGRKKIASIGVGVKKWISYHGLAVNINTDLGLFSLIKPCGLDVDMTSLADIKGQAMDFAIARRRFMEIIRAV
jgi:lipoate-protein ligase B